MRSISSLALDARDTLQQLLFQIREAHSYGEFSYTSAQHALVQDMSNVMDELLLMDVTPSQMPATIQEEIVQAHLNEGDENGKQ